MRRGGFVLVISALAVIAGCSSGGGSLSGSGGGSGSVSPGHGSPKAAVEGFITDLELGNGSTAWCDYLAPPDQSECQEGAAEAHISITGSFALGNQVIDGSQALVAITGDVCAHDDIDSTTSIACSSNSDPNKGLPSSTDTFSDAYAAATNSNGTATAPCEEISGSWYINIPGLSGTSTSTTTPNGTPTTTPGTTPTTTATTTPSSATTTPTTTVP